LAKDGKGEHRRVRCLKSRRKQPGRSTRIEKKGSGRLAKKH